MFQSRIEGLQSLLVEQELDAMLVSEPADCRYLTGLVGHGDWDLAVLVTRKAWHFLTNDLYREAFEPEVLELGGTFTCGRAIPWLEGVIAAEGLSAMGLDSAHLTLGWFDQLTQSLDQVEWRRTPTLVKLLRRQKDAAEGALLSEACRLTDLALEKLLPTIAEGQSELELAHRLETIVWEIQGDGFSFDPIIGFGEHSSRPHHQPTGRVLQPGELIQFDLGVRHQGYGGDLSRVAVLGDVPERIQSLYETVQKSQILALDALEIGVDGREVDRLTKAWLSEQAVPPYTHGLGHGIGLDPHVHEAPTLHERMPTEQPLNPGVVFTIEPAVYLEGQFGIRVEDVVWMTREGPQLLSHFPKALIRL